MRSRTEATKERGEYKPLSFRQITDPHTGMWIRGYVGQSESQLRSELNTRKEALSVPDWRTFYAERLI